MSAIKLSTPSSGSISLSPADTASNLTITVPAQSATIATLTTPSFATTIGVGGATAAASGAGITFPVTQSASSDANTLDDYEEGTWTPGVTYGGGSTGQTYSLRTGTYTKVGRLVTVCAVFNITNNGSSTGIAVLSGLPFSITNDGTGNFMGDGLAGTFAQLGLIFASNVCFFAIQSGGTGGSSGWLNMDQGNFGAGGKYLSFSYFTS